MAAISELLRDAPLVTLVGPGGVGKTRMAAELADQVGQTFPDGVCLVEFAPLADAALVPGALLSALGLSEQPDENLHQTIARALRGRRILLVVDNCEHVLEATASIVQRILADDGTGGLRVLATSRVPLGLYGEREYQIRPLLDDDSLRLFVERARLASPNFAPSDGDNDAIAAICRRLDGLPLAVELAAARVKVMSPAALLARLTVSGHAAALDLLAGGPRDVHPRQRALRDTVEWSYRLLDDGHQRLYRRLAIFVGGFSVDSAAAVAELDGPQIWDGIVGLIDASLITTSGSLDGDSRFAMLETIREHAREALVESGELEECARRHAAYFVARGEQIWSVTRGREMLSPLALVESDVDNRGAALRWLLEQGAAEDALRLASSVVSWDIRSGASEGSAWLRRVLDLPGAKAPTPARARALGAVARFNRFGAGWPDVNGLLAEALGIAHETNQPLLSEWLHVQMGSFLATARSDLSGARHHFEAALAIAREHNHPEEQSRALFRLGCLSLGELDYEWARVLFDQAMALATDDRHLQQTVLSQLGHIAHGHGDLARARDLFGRSLVMARENADANQIATLMRNVGLIAIDEGDQSEARTCLREALRQTVRTGQPNSIAYELDAFAGVAASEGMAVQALRLVGASAAIRSRTGFTYWRHDEVRVARQIAPAYAAITAEQASAALAAGRALDVQQAIAEALAL
jgi:predicted ATPase